MRDVQNDERYQEYTDPIKVLLQGGSSEGLNSIHSSSIKNIAKGTTESRIEFILPK